MYKMIIKIAWASLTRRLTRNLLVVLMIAMSLWGLLFMQGIYEGMTEQMIDNAIRSSSGDITLYKKGYRLENEISKLITDDGAVESLLRDDPRVKSFIKRIKQDGLIATAKYSRGAVIYGIDLEAERRHGNLDGYMQEGDYGFGKKNNGAIIGAKLAKKLKLKVGKKIVLSAQSTDNEVSSIALKVSGIIKTNNMAVDESGVFINLDRARKMLNVPVGVTQFCIILHDEKQTPELQNKLRSRFKSLEVFRWDEMYPALLQGRVLMEGFSFVIYLLVFFIASLGIFGVILVSVLERAKEFGMMLAIGSDFSLVSRVVLFESFFIGFIGYVAGSLLGWATLYYFYIHGLDLTYFSAGLDAFGMDAVMYALIKPQYFVTAFLAVFLATVLSVIFPLRVLKKSKPIEAINQT